MIIYLTANFVFATTIIMNRIKLTFVFIVPTATAVLVAVDDDVVVAVVVIVVAMVLGLVFIEGVVFETVVVNVVLDIVLVTLIMIVLVLLVLLVNVVDLPLLLTLIHGCDLSITHVWSIAIHIDGGVDVVSYPLAVQLGL